jgi:hypothetical protein
MPISTSSDAFRYASFTKDGTPPPKPPPDDPPAGDAAAGALAHPAANSPRTAAVTIKLKNFFTLLLLVIDTSMVSFDAIDSTDLKFYANHVGGLQHNPV